MGYVGRGYCEGGVKGLGKRVCRKGDKRVEVALDVGICVSVLMVDGLEGVLDGSVLMLRDGLPS